MYLSCLKYTLYARFLLLIIDSLRRLVVVILYVFLLLYIVYRCNLSLYQLYLYFSSLQVFLLIVARQVSLNSYIDSVRIALALKVLLQPLQFIYYLFYSSLLLDLYSLLFNNYSSLQIFTLLLYYYRYSISLRLRLQLFLLFFNSLSLSTTRVLLIYSRVTKRKRY